MSLQSYTFAQLEALAGHAVGKSTFDTGNSAALIVAAALYDLANRHDWSWLRQPLSLDVSSASIQGITRASNVVTCNCANHQAVPGDSVRISGSTVAGSVTAFNGEVIVATTPDDDTFTFNQIGTNGSATVTSAIMIPGFIAMPANFLRMNVLKRRGFGTEAQQSTLDDVMDMRANSIGLTSTLCTWWALHSIPQLNGTFPPWRIEIYPSPTAAQTSFLYGSYYRALPIGTGSAVPDVPVDELELLAAAVRYQAILTETQVPDMRVGDYDRKLAESKTRDGMRQTNLGSMIPSRQHRNEYFPQSVSIR